MINTAKIGNSRRVSRWTRRFALSLLSATALPHMLLAQSAPSAVRPATSSGGRTAPQAPSLAPEEIVVTAEKRAENVQKIPVSVTVIKPTQLIAAGVHNFQDLGSVAPSLSVSAAGNGQNSSVEMRGVGAESFSYLTEPDVAILIDDVPVATQSEAFTNLSDVTQIEVLRGPQTTLFGKSASAGVVSITTARPSSIYSGKFSTSITGDGEETVDGTFSGPITDNLLFRLTGALDDFRGNVKNTYDGSWVNGQNTASVRGKLAWTPTDDLTIDITGAYTHSNGSLGLIPAPIRLPGNASWEGIGSVATAFRDLSINTSNSSITNDVPPELKYTIASGAVRGNYDLGWAHLLSISAYSDYKTFNQNDFDFTDLNITGPATHGTINGGLNQVFNEETTQFSQEFRLVSGPGPFRYVTGLWYANKMDSYDTVRGPYYPGLGTHLYANYDYNDSSRQYAVYGQTEWDITHSLTLVTGARANDERIAYDLNNFYKDYHLNDAHAHSVITGKAALEYHPTSNLNLFASYTRGYKGETYDLTSSFTPKLAALGPVKPEDSNSFEVGIKSQFFAHRLTLDLTAFQTDYTNFQAQTLSPILGDGFILANVGSLRTRGLELDGRARINSALSIDFGATYLDTDILSDPDGQCYYTQTAAQGCLKGSTGSFWNLAGKSLPNAPHWKGNIAVQYVQPLPNTRYEALLTGAVKYQTAVNYSLSPDPETVQPGFAIVNLSLAFQPTDGSHYQFSVFVNNLFDTHYYAGMTDFSAFTKANAFGFVPRDFSRYAGFRASYEF